MSIPPQPRRLAIAAALSLLAALTVLLVAALVDSNFAVAGDGHYLYATARSLAYDGDLDLTNQYRVLGDRWGLGRDPAADGWRLPPRELGPALLMVPGLWVHHGLGLAPAWAPAAAAIPVALCLGPCWLACARVIDAVSDAPSPHPRSADALALVAVLAFVVPFYAVGRSAYAHAADALACTWLLVALVEGRRPALLGLLLAAAVLVRLQNVLWLPWLLLASAPGRGASERARAAATLVGLGSLGLAPALFLGLAHPGSERGAIRWDPSFFDLDALGLDLLRVLGGEHGLLTWTPVAALALLGLLVAAGSNAAKPERRRLALGALAVLAAWTFLFACVRDVDGGAAFGARRFAGATGLLALGLGLGWTRLERSPSVAWARPLAALVLAGLTLANLAWTQRALVGALPLERHPDTNAP